MTQKDGRGPDPQDQAGERASASDASAGNRIGDDYKIRVLWDEFRRPPSNLVTLHGRPHIERLLNSDAAQAVMQHAQNFCWTVERQIQRLRGVRAPRTFFELHLPRAGEAGPAPASATRVLLDIGMTLQHEIRSGIQRVCMRCAEEGRREGLLVPVVSDGGVIRALDGDGQPGAPVVLFANDVYIVFETFWYPLEQYLTAMRQVKAAGGLVALCFYDLVPMLEPQVCQPGVGDQFRAALDRMLPMTDIAVGISRATMVDLDRALRMVRGPRPREAFFFHLGADMAATKTGAPQGDGPALPAALRGAPVFLSVGTLEPKKGYPVTLDAFDRLWSDGHAAKLVIVGRFGWGTKAVRDRIEAHPRLNTDLFWFGGASDALLEQIYARADCVVQASVAEGFGIPIVEAGLHNLPIIASDLPVFREVAGEALTYFESENAASLYDRLVEALAHPPQRRPWRVPSWADAVRDLHHGLVRSAANLRSPPAEAQPSDGRAPESTEISA